jgi:hypothetical protein
MSAGLVVGLADCVPHDVGGGGGGPEGSGDDDRAHAVAYDILFVIDDSPSMGEEQETLRRTFPAFVDVLRDIEGGLPDVHIAVVSSDVGIGDNASGGCAGDGDDGNFRLGVTDDCPSIASGTSYLVDAPRPGGDRYRNYTGTLEDAFSCIADLGDRGCGFEHHLEAMRRSLTKARDRTGPNAGFLRDDAHLAIIVIADEDDCSATAAGADALFDPGQDSESSELGFFTSFRCWEYGVECNGDDPAPREMNPDGSPSLRRNCVPRDDSPYLARVGDYVAFVKGLKADPGRVVVAGIIGDPEPVRVQRRNIDDDPAIEMELAPSCETRGIGSAAPATRLAAFLEAFPDRSVQQTICPGDGNLAGALTRIAERMATARASR